MTGWLQLQGQVVAGVLQGQVDGQDHGAGTGMVVVDRKKRRGVPRTRVGKTGGWGDDGKYLKALNFSFSGTLIHPTGGIQDEGNQVRGQWREGY